MKNEVKITNFKPYRKGSLAAFFSVTLPSGLIIHEVKLFQKESGNRWIGLPSRSFADKNGATSFKPILEFRDREACDALRDQILAALDALHITTKPAPAKHSGPPKARIPDSDIPF